MSLESQNQIAIRSGSKQNKPRSVLKYCNNLLSRISSRSSKSMLQTDAVPSNNGMQANQMQSNGLERIRTPSPPQLEVIPSNDLPAPVPVPVPVPMHLTQNNLNQANQNITVVENQQILNFNHANKLHIGNTYHISGSSPSSRKNSCSSSNGDKGKIKSPTTVGKR